MMPNWKTKAAAAARLLMIPILFLMWLVAAVSSRIASSED
jgi:hypothetical protein